MPLGRLIACAVLFAGTLAVAPPHARAANPIYAVQGVEVDVTGASAAAARRQAIDNAHRKAFDRLLERIVPRERLGRVPDLSADQLANYVRDFEVFDERTSDVRYLASLTLRFQPQPVRDFLKSNDIPFAETRSKPVVVLPVWGSKDQAVLWDNPNPWRDAWANRAEQTGLVPLTVPLGDLGDINAVDVPAALANDDQALGRIAERYGADDTVVTQARMAGDPEAGTASMQVISSRVGTPRLERTLVDNVQQRADEDLAGMLKRAADQVARDIEETWKRQHLLRFDDPRSLRVQVPLDGLQRWVGIRDRLDAAAEIAGVTIDMLTRDQVTLDLQHYGEPDQLQLALGQRDLVLERIGGDDGDGGSAVRGADGAAGDQPAWRLRAAGMELGEAGASAGRDGGAGTGGQAGGGDLQIRDLPRAGDAAGSE